MKPIHLFILASLMFFTSCNSSSRILDVYQLTKCSFDYKNISNVAISKVDLSKGFTLATIPQLTSALANASNSIPLDMVVNLQVKNPSEKQAAINKMYYHVLIDDEYIADGSTTQPFTVQPNQTATLPLQISCDIKKIISGSSSTATINTIKNLMGLSSTPSKVSLKVKPSFTIGEKEIPMPGFITMSFTLDGKEIKS